MTDPETPKTAGVIAPPLLIYVGALGLALGLHVFIWPLPLTDGHWRFAPAGVLLLAGTALVALSTRRFRRAETDVRPWKPTSALVTDGVYRLTRNPIYVGMSLMLAGFGFAFNSYWPICLLVPVLPVMHVGVILREERYLEGLFGDEYRAYKKASRRWL